jgi:hypothetical protein
MAKKQSDDQSLPFQVERYKFILQEIHSLNENLHRYLTLFQTLITGILGGGIYIFISWKNLTIPPETAKVSLHSLVGLLIILTLFVVTSIIVGIISWYDYRNEEVDLLDEAVGKGFRKKPSATNIWRWHETYMIIFIVIIVAFISIYVSTQVIPLIH